MGGSLPGEPEDEETQVASRRGTCAFRSDHHVGRHRLSSRRLRSSRRSLLQVAACLAATMGLAAGGGVAMSAPASAYAADLPQALQMGALDALDYGIVLRPALAPGEAGSVAATAQKESGTFKCNPYGEASFGGFTSRGTWDYYVNGKCTTQMAAIYTHASLRNVGSYSLPPLDKIGYNTVSSGDSQQANCAPCEGTWEWSTYVSFRLPDDGSYWYSAYGSCYIYDYQTLVCSDTDYGNID